MNSVKEYISLKEYVSKIKLEEFVLEHLEQTTEAFNEYLEKLFMYGNILH